MKKSIYRILLVVLMLFALAQAALGAELLIPGGQVVGLELMDNTLTVAAFDDTLGQQAKAGGLQIGDRITAVNGQPVQNVQQLRQALERTDGQVELSVLRNSQAKKLVLRPAITEEGPRLGVYLKQGITGVGTVTWYDPDSGCFGALGHGVNTADGALSVMEQGRVYEATVLSVRAGKIGTPGQLMSAVTGTGLIGSLSKNTAQGVFGTASLSAAEEPLPVGSKDQIRPGPATIRSTVAGNRVQEYSVEILKLYPNAGQGRNMLLKVTDPALITATGGIVQGMSGSPLVQDGKLIGAVTHVLVNDPTMGYGIFIENMLEAAG